MIGIGNTLNGFRGDPWTLSMKASMIITDQNDFFVLVNETEMRQNGSRAEVKVLLPRAY